MQAILAIDDESTFLEFLKENLELDGFQVEAISNPLLALDVFTNQHFDCVLLDVAMPGKDGIELLQEILDAKPHVPVIMLSGQSTIKIAVQALQIGASDFIEKLAEIFDYDKEELLIRAGKIPDDIREILRENPKDAVNYLREKFFEND